METEKPHTIPKVLRTLAHVVGADVKNRRLEIPEKFGAGYCAGFVFNEHIRLLILNYELKEDLLIDNPEVDPSARMILFKFRNVIPKTGSESRGKEMPSVLIATSRVHSELVIPIHTNRAVLNIEVDANYLKGLLDWSGKSPVLQSLVANTQPLLFEEMIFPSLQKIVDEIVSEPVEATFELFFRRVKAEELICRLVMELKKRSEKQLFALNSRDIEAIYRVRAQLLDDLAIPPTINDLSNQASMSPSKLKRLFKQIFGTSIFRYYQEFRMQEAARLLKEEKWSVSEVGYQLGFTNLSHFSRVFNDHIGMKPKQYGLRH